MRVFLCGHGIVVYRYLADKKACEKVTGNNHRICNRDTNIQTTTVLYDNFPGFYCWGDFILS